MQDYDISKIVISVTVNHTKGEITVRRTGDRRPISFIRAANQSAYHEALRDAAFYLLILAGDTDGGGVERQIELLRKRLFTFTI